MKRIFAVAVVFALCAPFAFAQSRAKKPKVTTVAVAEAEKPMPGGTTRVAIINLGYVLGKYERATAVKEEVQAEMGKLRDEAKKHMENIAVWQNALQTNQFKNGTKEQYEEKLIVAKRKLEDLTRTAQTKVGKAQQAQLQTLWSEIHEAVKTYSAAHGIDLVMAYGEPIDKKEWMTSMNLDRKLRGLDQGAALPFFVAPGVDITEAIAEQLNKQYRAEKDKATDDDPTQDR